MQPTAVGGSTLDVGIDSTRPEMACKECCKNLRAAFVVATKAFHARRTRFT